MKRRKLIIILCYPLAILFRLGVGIRELLFKIGIKKRVQSSVKSIGVGNLTVGGTGKTPFSEFLIEHYKSDRSLAFLSRGYGRSTKGFVKAQQGLSASDIGDEPMQVWEKYGTEISVQVCEDRLKGVEHIRQEGESDLIILDDVFQHRMITPTVNILLNNYENPFQGDFLLPAGRLRDARSNAKYADLVVYTKCPESISLAEKEVLKAELEPYAEGKPVFFSSMIPGDLRCVRGSDEMTSYATLSAIADSSKFESTLEETKGEAIAHYRFNDHHDFSEHELKTILNEVLAKGVVLVTTEKDWARIKHKNVVKAFEGGIFVLPIRVKILDRENEFWDLVEQQLGS